MGGASGADRNSTLMPLLAQLKLAKVVLTIRIKLGG